MSVNAATTSEAVVTPAEQWFARMIPNLESIGVKIPHVRHMPGTGELHVTLCLPNHERVTREKVLALLQDFEQSYLHTVTVSPAFTYQDDDDC